MTIAPRKWHSPVCACYWKKRWVWYLCRGFLTSDALKTLNEVVVRHFGQICSKRGKQRTRGEETGILLTAAAAAANNDSDDHMCRLACEALNLRTVERYW